MAKEEVESQEFKEKKELIRLQELADKEKHRMKMESLAYDRENSRLFHERDLERGRIRRAEEKKMLEIRDHYNQKR